MGKENYEQYLTKCLESEVRNPAFACRELAADLNYTTTHTDISGIDIAVNPSGLVQNQGLKIDLLCMKIHMLQRQLVLYKSERILNDKTKTG